MNIVFWLFVCMAAATIWFTVIYAVAPLIKMLLNHVENVIKEEEENVKETEE